MNNNQIKPKIKFNYNFKFKNLAILKIILFLFLLLCFTNLLNNEKFSNERELHDLFTDLIKCKGKCTQKEKQEAEDKIDKYYEDEIKQIKEDHKKKQSKKVLKYFGRKFCPYSNECSVMYKMINEDFRNKYSDVEIMFNWMETYREKREGNYAQVEKVPTLLNKNYKKIDLLKPTKNVLENIYQQL